ncbi:cysteine hydrolase family protein [Thermodesulfitimonas sp.]
MRALIVIDMLNDFMDPKGVLFCGEAVRGIIPAVKEKVEEFRRLARPVIYACDAHDPQDEEFRAFPPHCLRGSWGAAIIPELIPREGDFVVYKTRFDAFFGTELEELLRKLSVAELCLTGVCTSICVMDTAAGAFFRDFKIKVFREAVGDFDPEAHAFALKRMERVYRAEIL